MIKRVMKSLFFLGLGVLCAALVFEMFLRAVELSPAWKVLPLAEVSLYGPDENTSYTHRPNVKGVWTTENRAMVSTTSFSIRSNGGKDEVIVKGDEWLKVGLVGNSITEALQVNDNQTFSALTEQILQSGGHKVRVYNLGLSGSPPAVEAERAKYYAEYLDLDLIIVLDKPENLTHMLGQANGFAMPYYKFNSDGGVVIDRSYLKSGRYQLRQSGVGQALYFLMDHFKIMTVLNNRLNRGIFAELEPPKKTKKGAAAEDQTSCNQESLDILTKVYSGALTKKTAMLDAFMDDLAAVHKRYGTKVVYSLFDIWADCPQALHGKGYANLEVVLEKKGIAFLNLKQSLYHNLPQGSELIDLRGFGVKRGEEGHLNETGHYVFAQALSEYITALYPDIKTTP